MRSIVLYVDFDFIINIRTKTNTYIIYNIYVMLQYELCELLSILFYLIYIIRNTVQYLPTILYTTTHIYTARDYTELLITLRY
jgi:hypothetical protein